MPARVLDQLRRRIEAHRLAVQQPGEKGGGLMVLDPRRHVDQQRETGCVRLGEAVLAEAQDLPIDRFGERARVATLQHAVDQLALERFQAALAPPCRHRATQLIGFAGREAGRDHRQLHHLLLEDRHAERARQHRTHRLARIVHRLFAVTPAQVRMHHAALDRPGPHDRHLDHQIEEASRTQPRQHRHLRARLDLEHAHGVGRLDHRVGGRILGRNVGHREVFAGAGAEPRGLRIGRVKTMEPVDQRQRTPDRREHAQRQHVDFQQPERIQIVLVPLNDAALGHRGVLDRHQFRERPARDHEPAGVLRQVARKTLQHAQQRDQLLHHHAVGVEAGFAHALGQHVAAVPPGERFRQPVDFLHAQAERLADVAHRALGAIGDDRGGECGAITAVLAVDVLDHFLAALMLEVDVDVGRLVALARDEALEQHRHARRIDLGDAQRVAHRRVRRRAAALAQDVAAAREAHDVVHGEKVGLVVQLGDQRQLVLDQLAHVRRDRALGEAPAQPLLGEHAQMRGRRFALGDQLVWILVAQFVERKTAALGNTQRFGEELGRIELRQPQSQPQMALGIREQGVSAVRHGRAQPDRGERVLQRPARTHVHVYVAGGNERQPACLRQLAQPAKLSPVVRTAVQRRGDPRTSGEAIGEPARVGK